MAHPPLLADEARRAILARRGPPAAFTVERGHIARFAEAIGDPNPLWSDERASRASRHGGTIAPPTFLRAAPVLLPELPELAALSRLLDAGSEWEYGEPVRPGDTITTTTRIASLSQRSISLGPALFLVGETTYTNQLGQVAATQRFTLILY